MDPTVQQPPGPPPLPLWRAGLVLLLALCPWLAVYVGLYEQGSALRAFLYYHAICVLGGLILKSPGLSAVGIPFKNYIRHLIGVAFVVNLLAAVLFTLIGAALLDRTQILDLMSKRGLPPATYLYLFPYFCIVNPLVEEYFWRGGVYATIRQRFGEWQTGAIIASFFFGAWHWLVVRLFVPPWLAITTTLAIAGVGFVLTLVYERTRSLALPIALHAVAGDAPLLVILALLSRG
jgi:membrane protease YdiL (CAAX protease family)